MFWLRQWWAWLITVQFAGLRAISLIVMSIMTRHITYISCSERQEMNAPPCNGGLKKDIRRIFGRRNCYRRICFGVLGIASHALLPQTFLANAIVAQTTALPTELHTTWDAALYPNWVCFDTVYSLAGSHLPFTHCSEERLQSNRPQRTIKFKR